MQSTRPKILGTLKISRMMAGNLAVMNDIKNAPNKLTVTVNSMEHGEELIAKLQAASPGDIITV
jgi:translation elongation factor EF-1alpha